MTPSTPKLTAERSMQQSLDSAAPTELKRMQRLRERYQQGGELWSAREWAHLHFLRWLVRTGRLVP